jgi:hypothetical protein
MLTVLAHPSRMPASGYRNGLAGGFSHRTCRWDTDWREHRGAWYHKAGDRLPRETRGLDITGIFQLQPKNRT